MAYTKKYFLARVKRVNELYKDLSAKGITNEFIYKHHVRDQFNISRSTFYDYLTIPYERQLKEIVRQEQQQLALFDS